MCEAKFDYNRYVPRDEPVRVHWENVCDEAKTLSAVWIKTAAALVQVRRQRVEEKLAWMTISTSFLASTRVSFAVNHVRPRQYMLYEQAALYYSNWVRDIEDEVASAIERERRVRRAGQLADM
jgi:hypothetical protein